VLELAAGGGVLELAIGTGRVAVPLAEHDVPRTCSAQRTQAR
jgi:ubiquinone/menaquinone biosynthesis C-methylase UbiE